MIDGDGRGRAPPPVPPPLSQRERAPHPNRCRSRGVIGCGAWRRAPRKPETTGFSPSTRARPLPDDGSLQKLKASLFRGAKGGISKDGAVRRGQCLSEIRTACPDLGHDLGHSRYRDFDMSRRPVGQEGLADHSDGLLGDSMPYRLIFSYSVSGPKCSGSEKGAIVDPAVSISACRFDSDGCACGCDSGRRATTPGLI